MASSLETNKLLAAILTAGVIASGSGVISRIIYSPEFPEEAAYQVAVEGGEAADGEAAAEAETPPLPQLLAEASVEDGEGVARACGACHSFEQGGPVKIGPPLWGVVGRDIAVVEGFAYSPALAEKEGAWTFADLSAFLEDPRGWAPGTKMSYAGVKDAEDRADLLAYMNAQSESPEPLPEPAAAEAEGAEAEELVAAAEEVAEEAAGEAQPEGEAAEPEPAAAGEEPAAEATEAEQQTAAAEPTGEAEEEAAAAEDAAEGEDGGIGALLAQADAGAGEQAARVCAACHSFEQGGPNKIGPPLWGVVGRDIAALDDFNYSDALQAKEGEWDYQALDAYLADPRGWAPGTRMAFAGLRQDDRRADVILYLRSLADSPEPLPGDG